MRASASSHGNFRSLTEAENTQDLKPCFQQVPNNDRSSLHARNRAAFM
jgi:hypothetical protein